MNFLKKRLKSHKKGHHDDDDDLDYIPPVPPHPSEIAKIQEQQKQDLLTSAVPPEDPATVIAKKKINKDKEEWKFFEKLTAKVEETVVQTQSNLDKIKETSTAEEIANKPDIEEVELTEEEKFFEQSESKIVARDLNSWVPLDKEKTEDSQAQSETADNNNSAKEVEEDQPVKGKKKPPPKPKPPKPPLPADTAQTEVASSSQDNTSGPQTSSTFPLLDSDTCGPNSHSENPLDDFGFGGEPANTLTSSELIFDYENDYLDDPFDTSFVNISIPEPVKYEPTDRKEKFSALISQLSLNKESTNNHRTRNSKSDHRRQESISHNFISSSSNHNRDSSFANTSETHDFDPIPSTNSIIKPNLSEITESKNTLRNQQPLSPQPLSPTINRTIGSSSSPPILSPQHPPTSTTAQAFSQPIEDTDLDLPFLSNKLGRSSGSRYGSNTSIASIMSNPFLVDTEYYTPTMGSGTTTPFSGTATPRRRNSTNPFEQSPEEEYPINIEASAIAAMTEDFQKAIGGTTDDQEDTGVISASDRGSLTMPEPFDPFATIHDDYIETPKRQSVSKVSTTATDGSMGADDVFEFGNTNLNSALDKSSSNYRRDLDDLDVIDAKINIIDNEKINTYDSSKPISGMKLGNTNLLEMPDTSGADYLSDISDTDEPYHSNDEHSDDASSVRKSSAFQMDLIEKDKDEPPPKFDPLPADAVIKRKLSIPIEPRIEDDSSGQTTPEIPASGSRSSITHHTTSGSTIPFFDPFSTVIDKDSPSSPKVIGFSSGFIDSITKTIQERSLNPEPIDSHDSSPTVEKNYLDYSDVKEVSDQVLPSINDEDSENLSKLNEISTQATCSVPQTQGISRTSDTFAASEVTTHDNYEAGSDSGLAVSSSGLDNDPTDPGRDPFDTSEFMESTKDSVPFTDAASFDAFQTRFDQTSDQRTSEIGGLDSSTVFDPFASPANKAKGPIVTNIDDQDGFDVFDPFASSPSIRPPKNTPRKAKTGPQRPPRPDDDDDEDDDDDDEADNFRVVIRSKEKTGQSAPSAAKGLMPLLPPPPKPTSKAFQDPLGDGESVKKKKEEDIDEFEAFFGKGLNNVTTSAPRNEAEWTPPGLGEAATKRTDSLESPSTPLFDDDVSQPLEDFPPKYEGDGWDMFIRHPAKKKLTGNRYWKKVFVRLSENSVIQLYNKKEDKEPFQELPLQPCYSLSEISSQQYDQYGKIFTIKLQYIFYRERVGVRKGQIAKVMQGQITSVGGLAKLGMPLEHAPQVSQLIKIGSLNYEDLQVFTYLVEEAFFRMVIHRDRALTYKTEEIQVTVVDEYYVETTKTGLITKQLARVRLFMLAFINGMPTVEVGVNDMTRQGKEVVGRHDIIPVVTEEWIRLEAVEFHSSVDKEEFEKETRLIKVVPPDACFFELMRFRVRPPKQRELPLQVTANLTLTKAKVELRCEVLVPGCVSRKYGQIPCEDIAIRIHIPECWIYFFRTEKHLRYGSVKSTSRRPGKIKGIERFLGTTQNFEPTMLETSAGSAKYEHAFHSLVWRIPKLPKEGQGAYTQQLLVCRLPLTSFDQVPDKFYEFVHIEFTMPSTTVSHAVVRSISVSPTGENPPEKYVRNIAKHEYKTDLVISYKENDAPGNSYNLAPVNPHPNHSSPAAEPEKQANVEDSDDSD